ncbi:FAD-dependent thymidylate synthase [Candidatus Pacearchaeota archaeon]|nr:FAD-dependent thymidylate synthase [Candidatus Pacearchaeota archaeon]
MIVKLLKYTPEPDKTCAAAALGCYSKKAAIDIIDDLNEEKIITVLSKIVGSGHHSIIEHASFTFSVGGVSRALTHQLVRHRIASYSQQSQRYVKEGGFDYIIPPKIKANKESLELFEKAIEDSRKAYDELLKVVPAEDARFLLPNACETRIVVTMNTRALYNFLQQRLCTRAQWEIRGLAEKMLELCKEVAPILFENIGPKCDALGYCPEERGCGRKKPKKEVLGE